jgi:predicted DNA-binding transcriptional regulator AlpA
MSEAIAEIDDNAYLSGATLGEALFQFGDPELIEAYDRPSPALNPKPQAGVGELLQGFLTNIQGIQNLNSQREQIIQTLKREILVLIKKGELIPLGFKEPRNIQDKPIRIPADLFQSGELNWDNSELKFRAMEFTGIRLLEDLMPPIDIDPENSEIKPIKKIRNSKFSKKLDFSNLPPDRYIDEKQVAEYLGISAKTLQGYRVKGGGPEFMKLGHKTVRYKFSDIQRWAEIRKKKNTSE